MTCGSPERPARYDAVVVGAGFAGIYMLHRLRSIGLSAIVLEAGDGIGGTWHWNRYPGARCDVESVEYSYSFSTDLEQEWNWSERYAPQAEILRYLEHVVDRFDLRNHIQLDTTVDAAAYDEPTSRWNISTASGLEFDADMLVLATGSLSVPAVPAIPGLDRFRGAVHHTARWPRDGIDLAGRRVGVIGTGSSGVQVIPRLAEQAAELVVFQRTAAYSVPAHNRPLDPDELAEVKTFYPELRRRNREMPSGFGSRLPPSDPSVLAVDEEQREKSFSERWEIGGLSFLAAFDDLLRDPVANEEAAGFVRERIHEVVADPRTAALLTPAHPIGCKRQCVDTGYYETFNRSNVRLVDISTTPMALTGGQAVVGDEQFALDTLVLATGFDAVTGAPLRIDIRGRDGLSLRDAWQHGPRTYLGLGVPGFPNLFAITGPGSPSVLTNMVTAIEQNVEWITDCIEFLRAGRHRTIEATTAAADRWGVVVRAIAGRTLLNQCDSWYRGSNIPGKSVGVLAMPNFPLYAAHCDHVAAAGYEGFVLT